MNIKPNKQPCAVCRNHKPLKPFKFTDDNGKEFKVTHICNCPYCGRFLAENYGMDFKDYKENVDSENKRLRRLLKMTNDILIDEEIEWDYADEVKEVLKND